MSILKKLYNKSKEEKGFTLVELIVVLVIIAILAAILVPSLLKYIDTAKGKQASIDARTAYLGVQTAVTEVYAKNPADLSGGSFKKEPNASVTAVSGSAVVTEAIKYCDGIQKPFTCSFTISGSAIGSFVYKATADNVTVELKDGALVADK